LMAELNKQIKSIEHEMIEVLQKHVNDIRKS